MTTELCCRWPLKTSLNLGDLDHFLEHVHRVLQILKLLEQRDHVDGGHVLRVGEGQAVELVDILMFWALLVKEMM